MKRCVHCTYDKNKKTAGGGKEDCKCACLLVTAIFAYTSRADVGIKYPILQSGMTSEVEKLVSQL